MTLRLLKILISIVYFILYNTIVLFDKTRNNPQCTAPYCHSILNSQKKNLFGS